MAGELVINLPTITYNKTPFAEALAPGILTVTVTGKQVSHGAPTLSTSPANLNKGNVGTIGFVFIKNLDATNTVQYGSDGVLFNLSLKPTEWAIHRWNAAQVSAKASAGTPIIEYWMVED